MRCDLYRNELQRLYIYFFVKYRKPLNAPFNATLHLKCETESEWKMYVIDKAA